jgi:hypothetical protein
MTNPLRISIELEEGERIEPAKSGAYLIRRSGQKMHVWYEHAPGDEIDCPECEGNGHYWIQTVLLHKERETCSTCKGASAVTVKSVEVEEEECERCESGEVIVGRDAYGRIEPDSYVGQCSTCKGTGKRWVWVIEYE